ncbi:alpha/beta fold hydrolase [Streptomyces inhibens]|uniref:alpha/beta fold hydrolase n=1 Tax=Streptomyces inhibens TaxID=2293571 RepID=UPI00402A6DEA
MLAVVVPEIIADGNPSGLIAPVAPTMRDPKLLRRLARVRVPTLVVWGQNDSVVSPDLGRAYAAAFANARFTLVPDAGHIPTCEAPDATLAAIGAFLAPDDVRGEHTLHLH